MQQLVKPNCVYDMRVIKIAKDTTYNITIGETTYTVAIAENQPTGIQELVKEYNAKENLTKKELSEQVDLISKMSLISSYRTKESQVFTRGLDDVLEEIKNTDTSALEKQIDNMTSEQADAIDELFDDFYEEFGGAKKYGIKLKELMGTIPELEKWMAMDIICPKNR